VTADKKVFEVRPIDGRRWRVSAEGSPSVAMFVSERDAVQYAHACAQAFRPCAVHIFDNRGDVRDAWRYGELGGIRASASTSTPDASSAAG
jgi:hypothetical protein